MPPFDPPATTTTWTTNNLNITGTDELWTRTFPYTNTYVDATPRTFTWNMPEYVEKNELENICKSIRFLYVKYGVYFVFFTVNKM